jgi:hypothetical protein
MYRVIFVAVAQVSGYATDAIASSNLVDCRLGTQRFNDNRNAYAALPKMRYANRELQHAD